MNYLSILILLLLFGTAIGGALVYNRPRRAPATLLVTGSIMLLLWLPAKLQTPVESLVRRGEIGTLPVWSVAMNEGVWWLGLCLILLILAGELSAPAEEASAGAAVRSLIFPLLITAVALAAAGAGSLATLLASWMLLDLLWYLMLVTSARTAVAQQVGSGRILPMVTLFLLWLAALTLPEMTGTSGLDVRGWPVLTRLLLLVAALVQVGAFPFFHRWRYFAGSYARRVMVLGYAAPVIAGAALLFRLEAATDISLSFALPLTVAALLGLLWSATLAWRRSDDPLMVVSALSLGQTSLILLATIWAGPDAILAEVRVLLLAGSILLLATSHEETGVLWKLGPALALAALAGFPLTPGFAGRAAVYDAWLDNGRWLLMLVTALLHVPFIAAAMLLWGEVVAAIRIPESGRGMAALASVLLPAVGLISFAGLATASLLAWLAILLPAGGAFLLIYFLEETDAVRQTVQEALALPLPTHSFHSAVQEAGRALTLSLSEAFSLLEGERGLVWLSLILLLIWLVGWQL